MSDPIHVVCPVCATVNRVLPERLGDGVRCGRCKQAMFTGAPIAAGDADFDVHVGRSDVPQTAMRFGIRSIPTLSVFRSGREIARQAGAMEYASLTSWIRSQV